MTGELENTAEQERFSALLATYRTQVYNNFRAHKTGTAYPQYNDQSDAELPGLYTNLTDLGVEHNGNIITYLDGEMTKLARDLSVHPALLQTLLNQIGSFEEFYAQVDDARVQGFKPVLDSGVSYNLDTGTGLPVRTTSYVQGLVNITINNQQNSQQMGQ